jgi:hypothetical protein
MKLTAKMTLDEIGSAMRGTDVHEPRKDAIIEREREFVDERIS